MKKIACMILAVVVFAMPLQGMAQVTMTASGDGKVITVEGILDETSEKEFIIKVLKDGAPEVLTDDNIAQYLMAIEQGKSAADGSFALSILMGEKATSGSYVIQLTKAGSAAVDKTIYCYYLSDPERDAIMKDLNQAADAKALGNIVQDKALYLNIDLKGLYADLTDKDAVFEKMFARKQQVPFATMGEIQQCFNESCVLEAIKEAESGADAVQCMRDNAGVTKLDWTAANQLRNVDAVGELLRSEGFSTMAAFTERFDEVVCVCAFNQGIRSEFEQLIKTYEKKLSLPAAYGSASAAKRADLYKDLEAADSFSTYDTISTYITQWFAGGTGGNGGNGGNVGSAGSGGISGNGGISSSGGLGVGLPEEPVTDGDNPASSSALTPATRFEDLGDAPWAMEAIEYLTNQKIVNGVSATAFEPNRAITREEFVKILVEAFGISVSNGQVSFTDVEKDAWYAPYVHAAANQGIVLGISDTAFGVGDTITRQDMAVMAARTLEILGHTLPKSEDMPVFTDAAHIADYAAPGIQLLCEAGIMNGVSETAFDPEGTATRAMAAKVVYLIIKDLV